MSKKIRIAVVGVGNCFSSLYQGIDFYKDHDTEVIPGVTYKRIGGYHPADIEIVAAFDVDRRKVGRSVREAIFAKPNCARVFHPNVPDGPIVQMGNPLDGVSDFMLQHEPEEETFRLSNEDPVDIIQILQDRKVDIVLNYCPVGSRKATEFYAQCALDANVSFCNCIPVLSINSPEWESKFIEKGLPLVGSDMKSQFGASILSQMLQELAFSRGMKVLFHQQLNIGGNTDFLNMMVQERLKDKKISKENVIRAQNDLHKVPVPKNSLFAGPSTYIPYLHDNKVAYYNIRMTGFGDAPIELDIKLSVQDSENSAGVVIDALRFLKVAKEMGIMGNLRGASAFTQKSPPKQLTFEEAKFECDELASRRLTNITKRQVTKTEALEYMKEEYEELKQSAQMQAYFERLSQ